MPNKNVNPIDDHSSQKPWKASGEIADDFFSWANNLVKPFRPQLWSDLQRNNFTVASKTVPDKSQTFSSDPFSAGIGAQRRIRSILLVMLILAECLKCDLLHLKGAHTTSFPIGVIVIKMSMFQCLTSRIFSHFLSSPEQRRKQHTQWCGQEDTLSTWTTVGKNK